MKFDVSKVWIAIVAVVAPATRMKVHLNVAHDGCVPGNLNDSAAKVWACAVSPKSRVQDANGTAIQQSKIFSAQSLMMPDVLHEPLRRNVPFTQFSGVLGFAPLQIELKPCGTHDLKESQRHYAKSRNLKVQEKSRINSGSDGDEVVYAFTQTLRRVTRPTIDRCSNRATSKTSLPTLNEQRNCWV